MSPRGWRESATRRWILVDQSIHVFPKASGRHAWSAGKGGQSGFGRHEHPLSQRSQLTDGHTIARDDEGFPLVQCPQDSPTFVAELSLSDTGRLIAVMVAHALHAPDDGSFLSLKCPGWREKW